MLTTTSSFGHSETATRLRDAISQAGMTLFAEFDHAAGARDAGMELADEVVLVFGNPHAGTMLMQADPRVGVELPLRMLVWSQGGQTLVGYNDPKELAASYNLRSQTPTLQSMSSLLHRLAGIAAGSDVQQ